MLVSHVLVPPAMEAILQSPTCQVQAFLAAGHVCAVMGWTEYEPIAERYHVPIVVTGFEPLDLLEGILMAIRQLESGRAVVENQYARAVKRDGNLEAQETVFRVFDVGDRKWRGIGMIPASGYHLRPEFARFDAEARFDVGEIHDGRAPGLHRRPDPAGHEDAARLHGVRRAVFAAEAARGADGSERGSLLGLSRRGAGTGRFPGGAAVPAGAERAMSRPCRRRRAAEQPDPANLVCPAPIPERARVLLGHGSGGQLSAALMRDVIAPALAAAAPGGPLNDAAVVEVAGQRLAFTTDSFVVSPLEFPGGDIGELAVNGTVNDLAMMGAQPLALSLAYVIEEGLPIEDLRRITESVARAARRAGVEIVTGDTKVVGRGAADGLFVNTAGIGLVASGVAVGADRALVGDAVILSGPIGLHGVAIMSVREGLDFEVEIASDTQPLNALVAAIIEACPEVRVLRDPTRGGLASALNEIAAASGVGIELREETIPIPGPRARRLRDARPGPAPRRQRGQARGHRARRRCGGGRGGHARRRRGRGGSRDRPCRGRSSGHGHDADHRWLAAHRGHARRRAAAPNLLVRARDLDSAGPSASPGRTVRQPRMRFRGSGQCRGD